MREIDLKERIRDFALRIIRMFGALPKGVVAQTLGKQVLRSATSVGANYREADQARSKAEFIAKLGDALRELEETDYWLELLVASNVVASPRLAPLIDETRQLKAIFATIIRNTRRGR